MKINNFTIDTSQMSNLETIRQFTVSGDVGAEFTLIVLQNPASSSTHTLYYDFKSSSFESGHNDLNNNLKVKLITNNYSRQINFPSGSGEYVLKLITKEGAVFTRSISKINSAATLTFQAETVNTNSYETFPTTTSTGSLGSSGSTNFNWAITNKFTDANGFGLLQNTSSTYRELDLRREVSTINQNLGNAWYFKATENVVTNTEGDTEDTTTVLVASITDLVVGMELTYYKATTAPQNKAGASVGTVLLKSINAFGTSFKLTFSQAVGFDEGQTMTFRAYGVSNIFSATGAVISFSQMSVTPTVLTKALRTDSSSSTSIELVDTYGIAGGNLVTYKGVNVDNSSSNRVSEIATEDVEGSNGVITVEKAQSLTQGQVLTFIECFAIINFSGNIIVNSYPNADRTINFDIDKFLSVGTGS